MYYIVNQTNHIIAADNALLTLLSVKNIDELHHAIALKNIGFTTPTDQELEITTATGSTAYNIKSHSLSGVLGALTLIEIEEEKESKESVVSIEKEALYSQEDTFSLIDDEPITFDIESDTVNKPETEEAAQEEDAISILEDSTPFDIISDDLPSEKEDIIEEVITEKTTTEEPEAAEETTNIDEEDTPVFIDIENISKKIGISTEDYSNFLNEYIDTALTLEEDLKSTNATTRSRAINTISHLSNVLHLPIISKIMEEIENSDADAQTKHIQSFYNTLAKLTTSSQQEPVQEEAEKETETEAATLDPAPEPSAESFGTIDLSGVKPIHFDFQLEEAANDLSLPVELIEEFVIDFIDQAKTETEKMLKAYEEGDLDAIQKIGHLLKGTSSNLRINPLADTLYKIQFCEDSNQLEDLIKDYWGHFLSFELQINIKSK